MTFREWIKSETNQTWDNLKGETDFNQRSLLYTDYEEYCEVNDVSPIFDFGKRKGD